MKVVIHGPDLLDQSKGSYRVYAAKSRENAREVKLNGSMHPDEIEVDSREAVIDHVFDPETYDREPGDLTMYLADTYFDESCADLPVLAETTTEGEDTMAEPTAEQLTKALEAYEQKASYRYVAKTLEISAATAKKYVEKAKENAVAAAPKRSTTPRAPGSKRNVNVVSPDELRHCSYPGHVGERDIPATEENFAVRKSGANAGTFVGWCRDCNRIYGEKARAAKKAAAAAAESGPEQPVADAPEAEAVTAPEPTTETEQALTTVS